MLAEYLYQKELNDEMFLLQTIRRMREMVCKDVKSGVLLRNNPFLCQCNLTELFNYALENFQYINDEKNPFSSDHKADEFLISPRYFHEIKAGDCEDFAMWFAAVIKSRNPTLRVFFRVCRFNENEPFAHVYVAIPFHGVWTFIDAGNENPVYNFEPLAVERRNYEV